MTDPLSPLLLVISGPAGSGKTTLCARLTGEFPHVRRLVTTTTRQPRPNETDGIDYHFISPEAFLKGIAAGDFIEWANVHDRHYGSQHRHVHELMDAGFDVLLNIDVQGAAAFRRLGQDDQRLNGRVISVFIRPASEQQLIDRMETRGCDDPQEIRRRLISARKEIAAADGFDHVIVSGSKEHDYDALRSLYLMYRSPCPATPTTDPNQTHASSSGTQDDPQPQ
jgi:guanylate kinase